jgi:hypothetical protein
VEHADENWPDCVDVRLAPPSGVRFQEDETLANSTASVLRLGAHNFVQGDVPIKLNALTINAIDLAEQLPDFHVTKSTICFDNEDESVNTDITVLFENGGEEDLAPVQFLTMYQRL